MRIFNFAADNNSSPSPSWAKKITRSVSDFIFGDDGTSPVDNLRSTNSLAESEPSAANSLIAMPNAWRVYEDRRSLYNDIERMDNEDELVSSALDIIADVATHWTGKEDSGITLRISTTDQEAQKIIDDLVARLDLQNEVWQIVRQMAKHGAYLPEVLIDRKRMKIVRLKQTVTYQIFPNLTEKGDKIPGWIIREEKDVASATGQALEEWQICPFLFGAKRGYLPVPLLASARRNWQRLSKIEDGMAVARLTRAYDKLVHRIPIKKEWNKEEILAAIRTYREGITKRKIMTDTGKVTQNESPYDVNTDFYLPDDGSQTGGITPLTSTNLQLGNLNDVYYSREKLLARLAVPISYLQIMSTQKTHLKSGSVGDADIRFASFLGRIQAALRTGLRRLVDTELVLQGKNPATVQYKIELAQIRSKDPMEDAKIELTRAQAAVFFVEAFGALPVELIASKFLELEPDQQEVLNAFLKTNDKKITDSRIKALETAAKPQAPAGGSGNQNKGAAKRSAEQRPGAKQNFSLEVLTDLFVALQEKVNISLQEAGIDVPDDAGWSRDVIRQNLVDFAAVQSLPLDDE